MRLCMDIGRVCVLRSCTERVGIHVTDLSTLEIRKPTLNPPKCCALCFWLHLAPCILSSLSEYSSNAYELRLYSLRTGVRERISDSTVVDEAKYASGRVRISPTPRVSSDY